MLLTALPDQRLVEIASLLQAIGAARQATAESSRARRRCLAELQAQLLLLKCSLGLYLNQTSPAAIGREMARRRLPESTAAFPGQGRVAKSLAARLQGQTRPHDDIDRSLDLDLDLDRGPRHGATG